MSKQKKPVVAICYDFDGTLSPFNMQEYGFFMGLDKKDRETFWKESNGYAQKNCADQNLVYMKLMLEKVRSRGNNLKSTRKAFQDYGKSITFYEGVREWFGRINEYGNARGLKVQHYIISSGLKEMVEGSSIGREFSKIYACTFLYDSNGVAEWPAQVVNCTSKTQYLFRINKGIDDDSDTKRLNEFVRQEDRPVPFTRMVYIGDGTTDIPCMRLVKEQGGFSIAVYRPKSKGKHTADKLYRDGRVNFIAQADYRENAPLDGLVKAIIDKIESDYRLEAYGKRINPRPQFDNCEKRDRDFKKVVEENANVHISPPDRDSVGHEMEQSMVCDQTSPLG